MKTTRTIIAVFLFAITCVRCSDKADYEGKYCSGSGDIDFLRLIDESFAFFHPNPAVPNLTMVYNPEWNTFVEGAGWGAWWIQNSYGFSYAATPFLEEPWASTLQRSWDLFWMNQGDGTRMGQAGADTITSHLGSLLSLIAPDGSLGDCSNPNRIIYKQGDGNIAVHDWYYEGTAAGLVMQAEILLVSRDEESIKYYLPKMERACDFIEHTRDTTNNLFLVGPAANLLAPSYGGVKQPDGQFGKAYLSGLSVTYLAALDRMVELYKLMGNIVRLQEYEHRQKITRESLPLLMTGKGYFVKSMEQGGPKHGVLGQKKYGYLEGVVNADAVALRVVSDGTAKNIYKQIAAFPAIRPFDFLLTNAPGLDDTYWSWGNTDGKGMGGFHKFGDWVNGGAWGTVEGRAILMYYRLGKFQDIRRSATRAMKWAKDFRMDAPWSQLGENTSNPWSDTGKFREGSVAVMIDNFAIPAATIRGLFDYEYKHDRIIMRPRVPGTISEYSQKEPVRFGNKKLFISCKNGGKKIGRVKVNGEKIEINSPYEVEILFAKLPEEAKIEITTAGGWENENNEIIYPSVPSLVSGGNFEKQLSEELPESLKKPYGILLDMKEQLSREQGADYEKAMINTVIESCQQCVARKNLDTGAGYYRPVGPERKKDIENFYEKTALTMVEGFHQQMKKYKESGNDQQKRIAKMYFELK